MVYSCRQTCTHHIPIGQAGAELLNKYINAYFERLIERLSAHGGDVIKFAGDALQCIWRHPPSLDARQPGQEEGGLPSLVLQASACCIDLLASLNNYSPVPGVILQLHIGVGAGTISSFCVGGYKGKWEYFISGEPIEQARAVQHQPTTILNWRAHALRVE